MDRCEHCQGTGIKVVGGQMQMYEDGTPIYCIKCALGVGLELGEVTGSIAKHEQALRQLERQPNTPVSRRMRRDSKDMLRRLFAEERSLGVMLNTMTRCETATIAKVADVVMA